MNVFKTILSWAIGYLIMMLGVKVVIEGLIHHVYMDAVLGCIVVLSGINFITES